MKILHLYYDIMNLYGDYANVSAMQRILEKSGEDCTVDRLSLGDNAVLSDYSFIFIGSGTERNRNVVMDDFHKYKVALKDYINSGKVLLMTGNSFEMLGSLITDAKGEKHEGLGIFNFTVTEQSKTRNTSDAIFKAEFSDKPLVGFVNKCSEIEGITDTIFEVVMGLGNNADDKHEGIRLNNFFGTHLTGPVLMKNPFFLEYMASLVLGDGKSVNTRHLGFEKSGYDVTLSELTKRLNS